MRTDPQEPDLNADPSAAPRRVEVPSTLGDEVDPAQMQALTADISARLRRVCPNLSDEEFADLVVDIARVRLRYEQRAYGGTGTMRRSGHHD